MKKLLFIFCACALTAASCKKSDQPTTTPGPAPTPAGKYLTKISYWTPANNTEVPIRTIDVNASGDITAIKTFSTASKPLLTLVTFSKDGSGRINKVEGTDQNSVAVSWAFEYDGAGNVAKSTYTKAGDATVTNYTYDSDNRITKEETLEANGTGVISRTTYTYTGSDKNPAMSKSESLTFSPVIVTEYTYTYDTKKNPAHSLPGGKLLYYMDFAELQPNNVLERKETGGTTVTYTYEYNANDYATSKKGSNGSGLKYYYQ